MFRVKQTLLFFAQLFFICAIYAVAVFVVGFFHLPIPGSVLGMLILFFLLASGIVKLSYVELAGSFLNRHLGFFFVPITVGLMDFGGLIKVSGLQIFVMIAGSTMVGLLVTGGLAHYFSKGEQNEHERHNTL
ncbi:CidA/LrgA family protein [Neobacillus sp. YIM B06451]|uniref:CidA/LrgA family protein n=1 Tax=Neobacillus sp. YIM B06451 TaxID=3070994 RepID=UPI00292CADEA|nr:CidA/LrgA family protein [Neobacillus sp. YIM B06451]